MNLLHVQTASVRQIITVVYSAEQAVLFCSGCDLYSNEKQCVQFPKENNINYPLIQ